MSCGQDWPCDPARYISVCLRLRPVCLIYSSWRCWKTGWLSRLSFPELPLRSEYQITDLGKSLLPIIDAMLKWGEDHFEIFEKKYGCK